MQESTAGVVADQVAQQGAQGASSEGQVALTAATVATPTVASQQGQQVGAATAATAQQAAEWVGVRDILKGMGLEQFVGQYQDDNQALAALAASYRQNNELQQLAQMGREYQQHQGKFQEWARQQAEAERQRQGQQQQQSWWKAPEFDPSWRQKLTRDPVTGEIRALPGVPHDVVQKYLQAEEHRQQFLEKFAFNPIEAIKPGIEEIAKQVAQQMVAQHLGGYQQQVGARDFVTQNSGWLHTRDSQGNVVVDQRTGAPALSELGERFTHYVRTAAERGWDTNAQKEYALGMTQRDYLIAQQAQAQKQVGVQAAQTQGDKAKEQFLQQAAGSRGAMVTGAAAAAGNGVSVGANGAPMNGQRGLAEALMKNMQAGGFQPGQAIELTR